MHGEKFTNARVHDWLNATLLQAAGAARCTRVDLNSAALWWFLTRLSHEERVEVLGEYVKARALEGSDGRDEPPGKGGKGKGGRPKKPG